MPSATPGIGEVIQPAIEQVDAWLSTANNNVVLYIALGLIVLWWILKAILVGGLARSKGYAFFGNFLLGLLFGVFALIFEAGRPVSYERDCVMQDRLAIQTAKELYKLQRAREKNQLNAAQRNL